MSINLVFIFLLCIIFLFGRVSGFVGKVIICGKNDLGAPGKCKVQHVGDWLPIYLHFKLFYGCHPSLRVEELLQ